MVIKHIHIIQRRIPHQRRRKGKRTVKRKETRREGRGRKSRRKRKVSELEEWRGTQAS